MNFYRIVKIYLVHMWPTSVLAGTIWRSGVCHKKEDGSGVTANSYCRILNHAEYSFQKADRFNGERSAKWSGHIVFLLQKATGASSAGPLKT
jgi:hypothetical protein